jgi:hypothetical protein
MKPDLSQSDFDGLVQRTEQLAQRTRTRFGMDQEDEASGTPFDRILQVLGQAFELFGLAVMVVILVALLCGGGSKP